MALMSPYTPPDMRSDGCTFPGPLRLVKWFMGTDRYEDYCKEHDFLRRYAVMHWHKSNVLLAKRILRAHLAGAWRAPLYYFFTTISYPWYDRVLPLPQRWQGYAEYYRRNF